MSFPGRTPLLSSKTLFRENDQVDMRHVLKKVLASHAVQFNDRSSAFEGWMAVMRLSDATLCQIGANAPLSINRSASEEMVHLYFASEPGAAVTIANERIMLSPETPLALSTGASADTAIAADASLLILQIPHRRLISQLETLTGQKVSRKIIFAEPPSPQAPLAKAMVNTAAFLCGHLDTSPKDSTPSMLHENFLETIANFLLIGWRNNFTEMIFRGYSPAAPKYVYRAEEYMSRNVHKQITMEELVALTGVSSRSLQDGFRRFRNTTPMKWLRDRRLDEARHQLLYEQDALSIQEVALKWGFTNHPHFSRAYRERFGESPQRTRSSRSKRKD